MTPEELLAQLRAGGRVDSQGKFTLAGEAAREKLRRFQLRNPTHYLLFALRAAVAAGASELIVEYLPWHVRIDAPGWTPPRRENLVSGLFESPDEQPAAYYLGVVANMARVEVDAAGLSIRPRLSVWTLVRMYAESALLSGLRSRVPVRSGRAREPLRAEPYVPLAGTRVTYVGEACRVELAPLRSGKSRVHVYKHGLLVPYYPKTLELPGPPVDCHVEADTLRLDLSGQHVVNDERWEAVARDVRAAVGKVVEHLCSPELVPTAAIRGLLLRAFIERCLGRRSPLKVSKKPLALGMAPAEVLRPSTPEMAMLVETPIIELQGGSWVSPRQLAQKVRRAWGPPPASSYAGPESGPTRVLVNVLPGSWPGAALFVCPSSAALLECWPAQPCQ